MHVQKGNAGHAKGATKHRQTNRQVEREQCFVSMLVFLFLFHTCTNYKYQVELPLDRTSTVSYQVLYCLTVLDCMSTSASRTNDASTDCSG